MSISVSSVRPRLRAIAVATIPAVLAVGAVWLPAAHATDSGDVTVTLGPGQSQGVNTLLTSPGVVPVATCDPGLSITWDANNIEWVHVAPDAPAGTGSCTIDYQYDGQSVGFIHTDTVQVPGLSISNVTVAEPDSGTTPATFTVSMSQASTETVTAAYTTADDTASVADYGPISGTVTFAPGQTSQTLTVAVDGDTVDEADEVFYLNLSDGVGAAITNGHGVATIDDQDRNGVFTCKAAVMNALGVESIVANAPGNPCQDSVVQTPTAHLDESLFSITVSGPSAATDQTPDVLSATAPAAGDSATATATLSTVTIVTSELVTISLDVMTSSVTAECVSTANGLVPQFSASSVIVDLNVGGTPITIGADPTDIPLIIGTLHLNNTVTTGTSVTQRAVWLQTAIGDVAVDTATAGVAGTAAHPGGNPCVTR